MATQQQQAHALVTYFSKAYQEHYHRPPNINRYSAKYGFVDILQDVEYERVKQLVDFYFLTGANHRIQDFLYNYDKLLTSLEEKEADVENRRRLRAESKQRVREWEEREHERSKVN